MCVIAIAENERPTDEMVEKMFAANDQGAGIAWRADGYVHWRKGLDLAAILKLCKDTPTPYVAHFRIASQGGKRDSLCHPFPIDRKVPLNLAGKTKGSVLFHNGHWGKWRETVLDTVVKSGIPIPPGKWSDTRAMAFTAAVYGIGVLEFIDEKTVAFGPENCDLSGSGWSIVDKIWVSNKFWEHRGVYNHYNQGMTMCLFHSCTKNRYNNTDYCFDHQNLLRKGDDKKDDAEDDKLPVIDVKTEDKIATIADIIGTSRGKSSLLPFAEVERIFKAGHMSRNQFKKARKNYQKEEKALKKHLLRFHQETVPPIRLVVH